MSGIPYLFFPCVVLSAPVKPDPWAQFSPSSPDPRILFAVHAGPASSPLPLPLHPDDFSSSLKTAERRYLSRTVRVDVAAKEVRETCLNNILLNYTVMCGIV